MVGFSRLGTPLRSGTSVGVRKTSTTGREGAVLVVVLLLGLGMFALAHGLLLGAHSALTTARAGARLEEARVSVDEAMDRAVRRGPGPSRDSVPVSGSRVRTDTVSTDYPIVIRWRRLASELWLVEARADPIEGTPASVARIAWAPDPVTRLAALPATVSVGADATVSVAGSLVSRGLVEEQAEEASRGTDASCTRWWDEWPDTESPRATLAVTADAGLGPVSFSTLLSAAAAPEGMRATPEPRVFGGACDTADLTNWGDPTTGGSPCSRHFGLFGGEGVLTMAGGYGQGVLLVDGDVALTGGAHFFGLVIASGALRLQDGAVLEGFAVALGGVQVASGAEIRRSVCRGLRALDGIRDRLPQSLPVHGALDYGPR